MPGDYHWKFLALIAISLQRDLPPDWITVLRGRALLWDQEQVSASR